MRKRIVAIIIPIILIFGYLFFFTDLFKSCPDSCDDFNECTEDFCSEETDFKCVHKPIDNCCGNNKCEQGETYESCADDCPNCNDDDRCTEDSYDYHLQKCLNKLIIPCCGNKICESNEDYSSCEIDCPLNGYIEIKTSYVNNPSVYVDTGYAYYYSIANCLDKNITILELTNYDNGKQARKITKEWLERFPQGSEEYNFITISKDTCEIPRNFIATAQEEKLPNTNYMTKIYFKFQYGEKVIEYIADEEEQATTDNDISFSDEDLAIFKIDSTNVKLFR